MTSIKISEILDRDMRYHARKLKRVWGSRRGVYITLRGTGSAALQPPYTQDDWDNYSKCRVGAYNPNIVLGINELEREIALGAVKVVWG